MTRGGSVRSDYSYPGDLNDGGRVGEADWRASKTPPTTASPDYGRDEASARGALVAQALRDREPRHGYLLTDEPCDDLLAYIDSLTTEGEREAVEEALATVGTMYVAATSATPGETDAHQRWDEALATLRHNLK